MRAGPSVVGIPLANTASLLVPALSTWVSRLMAVFCVNPALDGELPPTLLPDIVPAVLPSATLLTSTMSSPSNSSSSMKGVRNRRPIPSMGELLVESLLISSS